MALRVISRAHNNQVAFGEKRTSTGRQSRPVRSRMTPERTWVVPDFCGACCRPYRLFVEAAAVRLITSRVALMTRSG